MRDVAEYMQGDDFICGDLFQADWARAIIGAMVTTGTGRCIFIWAGVGMVGGILLSADEVSVVVVIGFEGRTKIQNKRYASSS